MRIKPPEPCSHCGVTTNFYDPLMGRVCPKCVARTCASMGKSMALREEGKLFMGDLLESEIEIYLSPSNKYLLTEPLEEFIE